MRSTSKIYRVLSWGAGVQSTYLAVMSALGELDPLDVVIHSDTGWERGKTYETVAFYTAWLRERDIRVEIVGAGDIRKLGAEEHLHIPFWTRNGGPLQRQCTRHFKIAPVKRRIRELLGFHPSKAPAPPPGAVEQWIGFSWDESLRIKDSRVKFIVHRWPLIERRINRWDCEDRLEVLGLPVPIKSSCIGCPYRKASEWIKLKQNFPDEFRQAVEFDEKNRYNPLAERDASTADELFIYKHGGALADADLEADARRERKEKQIALLVCGEGQCFT